MSEESLHEGPMRSHCNEAVTVKPGLPWRPQMLELEGMEYQGQLLTV